MASALSEETVMSQYLTFVLSGHEMALGLAEVAQIIEHVPPTRVPHLPEVIRGVINLRGSVVPVVDLAVKLGLARQPVTRRTCIVMVESREAGLLGILADSVRQVIEIAPQDVLPTPGFGVPVRADYLLGLGKVHEKLVLLLDSARLLSPAELLAATAAQREAAP
jgi:purine-binding chemotaxis protein CheW